MKLTPEQQAKQEHYRDARFTDKYDDIWQSVGKCVFCDLRDKYIFFEEHGVVMTISLFAYIDGHFMIMPRRHVRSPKELTQREWDTVRKFLYIAKKLIRDVHGVKGMQTVQKDGSNAQSTVDQHLHFHCIPFDAPDLSVWNYRKLKHTPLENAELYRHAGKKLLKAEHKYEQSYQQPYGLPIVCDAVIVNAKHEVLLQERSTEAELLSARDSLPGGRVENFSSSLEDELARELKEETGLIVKAADFKLLASRLSQHTYRNHSSHLGADYPEVMQSLYNSYLLTNVTVDIPLLAGDDAKRLYWQPIGKAAISDRLSDGVRQAIVAAQDNL
jgi:diadenosine tetraphosphate (Ap4A) HIT family hydrolase/8-oxo-dGTP pyrophosphatase MutT (NUDIX family)